MKFIHFIDKAILSSVLKNGIKVNDCYRGKGILIYPDKKIKFKVNRTEKEYLEEEKYVNKLSINEKWKFIGALELQQGDKEVVGLKIKLTDKHYPMKVFVDINEKVAEKFSQLLDEDKSNSIKYNSTATFSEVIKKIKSRKYSSNETYVLEGAFIVKSQTALIKLINYFEEAGGGIWEAHSLDCMIELDIEPELILETKEINAK